LSERARRTAADAAQVAEIVEVSQPAEPEGPISEADKRLVQDSFALVAPIAETAAELFYGRLFELDPSLRKLFDGDMKEQGRKLIAMIKAAVKGLDRIEKLGHCLLTWNRSGIPHPSTGSG